MFNTIKNLDKYVKTFNNIDRNILTIDKSGFLKR